MALGFPMPFELGCIEEFLHSRGESYVYRLEHKVLVGYSQWWT